VEAGPPQPQGQFQKQTRNGSTTHETERTSSLHSMTQ
jgi:hypothetical protein